MSIISGAIGTALGAAGSIFGGIAASQAAKKGIQMIQDQREKNQDWYDRRYNEDSTQRADAQRLLTMTEENIRNRNRNAAGAAAVAGATNESVAAEKAANNQALAATTSAIAAQGAARKDSIESTYRTRDDAYASEMVKIEQERAKNIADAAKDFSNTVANNF